MPTWPTTLPQQLEQQGFKEEFPQAALRTPMDAGPPKVRQRFTAAETKISGNQTLTTAQRAVLREFFIDTLGHGAEAFDWVHPVTGADCRMRFRQPPTVSAAGGEYFQAQFELEILP